MTSKRYLPLSLLLLLFHGQTIPGNISPSHSSSLPDWVVGILFVVPTLAVLLSEDSVQGKHNPDNDTLTGGKLYGAKWGALLGTFGVFLCPNQLRNQTGGCQCTPDTAAGNALLWSAVGATVGAIAGHLRSASLDQKHNLKCAQELLLLTPELQELVDRAFEFETEHSPEKELDILKKISMVNATSSYPLLASYHNFASLKIRYQRIETYLNRALENKKLDASKKSLIANLMQNVKKTAAAIEKTIQSIGNHPAFHKQQEEKKAHDERERRKKEKKRKREARERQRREKEEKA